MTENKLREGWRKLNAAIQLLKEKGIIHRSNPVYTNGAALKFNSEKSLIIDYFLKLNPPIPFGDSTFSQLKGAFDKDSETRNLKYSATERNYEIANKLLDNLIEKTTGFYWHEISGYIERSNSSPLIDSAKLSLLLGTYVGHYKSKDEQIKKFIFIISKSKADNAMLIAGKKTVTGNVCLIDGNRLFFVLKTDKKNSPELILCHMGGEFDGTKKITHFIGISAWYDYNIERPSSSICIFCKVDKKYLKPTSKEISNYYAKVDNEHTRKISDFFEKYRGKTFIQLHTHFLS